MADSVQTSPSGRVTTARAALVLAGALALGVPTLAACGQADAPGPQAAPASSAPPAPDPAVKPYCDAVTRVQSEQSAPQAGQGGVQAASDAARRQIASLVATAPPEIAGDWRALDGLTNRALGSLAATGGDPKRIDHKTLDAISRQSQPIQARIKDVTQKRCGIAFSATGPAPAPTTTSPSSSSSPSSTAKKRSPSTTTSSSSG